VASYAYNDSSAQRPSPPPLFSRLALAVSSVVLYQDGNNIATLSGSLTINANLFAGHIYQFLAVTNPGIVGSVTIQLVSSTGGVIQTTSKNTQPYSSSNLSVSSITPGSYTLNVTVYASANSAGASNYTAYTLNMMTPAQMCSANQCENGATCVPTLFAYTCTCPNAYGGFYCDFFIPASYVYFPLDDFNSTRYVEELERNWNTTATSVTWGAGKVCPRLFLSPLFHPHFIPHFLQYLYSVVASPSGYINLNYLDIPSSVSDICFFVFYSLTHTRSPPPLTHAHTRP